MARRRVVTKTVVGSKYEVLGMDIVTQTPITKVFTITGERLPMDKALKAIKASLDTPTELMVAITKSTEVNKIYGMFEEKFIESAHEMTDERKFVDESIKNSRDIITRTIKATKYTILAMDIVKQLPKTITYTLGDAGISADKVLSVLKKRLDTNTIKVVAITDKEDASMLMGMTVEEFISLAKEMDEDRHFLGETTEDEIEIVE